MMIEKINEYCEMSSDEQAAIIEEHDKIEEMVAKMNEYCSLDETERQETSHDNQCRWIYR